MRGVRGMLSRIPRVTDRLPREDAIVLGTWESIATSMPELSERPKSSGLGGCDCCSRSISPAPAAWAVSIRPIHSIHGPSSSGGRQSRTSTAPCRTWLGSCYLNVLACSMHLLCARCRREERYARRG